MVEIENILYFSPSGGIGKSNLQRFGKKINIRNGKSKNFVYTAPTAKHGKA